MPFCRRQVLSPSIEAVPAEQEGMCFRMPVERLPNLGREARHVLIILQDRNPFSVRMRYDAVKALQHLVPLDLEAPGCRVSIGEGGAPQGVRMQHGAGLSAPRDLDVKQGFRRRAHAGAPKRRRALVDREHMSRS